jgi:hypothetical protein
MTEYQDDDEQFCSRCAAGVDSSEHVEKCVRTGHAEIGESAPDPHTIPNTET